MRATAQSKPRQATSEQFDAALREQVRLRSTLTPEELADDHRRKVEKFLRTCDEAAKQAQANGLTEEILAEILSEE